MSQQRKPRDLTSKQIPSTSPLNYQLAKNQNGDMLIDKTKKTPLKSKIGYLSGEYVKNVRTVDEIVLNESTPKSQINLKRQREDYLVPTHEENKTVIRKEFKKQVMLRLSIRDVLEQKFPDNLIAIEIIGQFHKEIVSNDLRCREFTIFDDSCDDSLLCKFWEIDRLAEKIGPIGESIRVIGLPSMQGQPHFKCFSFRKSEIDDEIDYEDEFGSVPQI